MSPALPSQRRPRPVATLLSALCLAALGLLAAAGSGCSSPAPFVPSTGCPTLTSCEQCASRGGCGWCASSCVAAEGAQCSSALVQSPNQCSGATPAQ